MSVWTDFENWRDEMHCGGEEPKEWHEAEIGAKYEMYDAVYDKVEKTIICTESNKDMIEKSLNDDINDIWWWRKVQEVEK